jgi:hypothetical protein
MMQVSEDKIRGDSAFSHGLIAASSVREKVVPSLRDSVGVLTTRHFRAGLSNAASSGLDLVTLSYASSGIQTARKIALLTSGAKAPH